MEELDTKIKVYDLIDTVEYDYPDFHLVWIVSGVKSPRVI